MVRRPDTIQTVTKAAFGGHDLRDLYMTTAWLGNADKWRSREEPRRLADDSWDHLKRDPDEDVA